MAEEQIKALFHRLSRRRRQPEVQDHYLDPPVMQPFTGESVAAELRRARQDLGRDLVRVADDLKIRRVYLQAIEDGRFDDLPGATYAVGFIRAYAEYLGLNSIETVGRFKEEVQGVNERLQLVFPTPVPESKIPSGAVLLISVLLIALAYGGWYYLSSGDDDMDGQVLDLPDSLERLVSSGEDEPLEDPLEDPMASTRSILLSPAEPLVADEGQPDTQAPQDPEEGESEPRAQAPQEPGEDEGEPSAQAPQEPDAPASLGSAVSAEFEAEPAAGASLVGVVSEAPSTTPEASTVPFVAAATSGIPAAPAPDTLLPDDDSRQPRVYGVENETARIVLRARLDAWVQVFAADESLILTRVLQPGDSYRVPDLAGLTLVTGNAGGLEIEVDGATVPPLGPVGAIRRGIALDAERLLGGTALAQ
jgi:cytoskeleton protein RodZ